MLKPIILLLLLSQISGCSVQYVIKQGLNQFELSSGSMPTEDAISRKKVTETQKQKLELVFALKRFAEQKINMAQTNNYTLINPAWKKKLFSVSGSEELAFRAHHWCFPVVGQIPYLGFFDKNDAIREEKILRSRGFDTLLGEVAGYSTLGFFDDPIWPSMLEKSVPSLSELILHELAHATLYFPGQTDFNESFANFVGKKAALLFLRKNYGEKSKEVSDHIKNQIDDDLYQTWINDTYLTLDKIYSSSSNEKEKKALKAAAIENARTIFKNIKFQSEPYKHAQPPNINNAYILMSRRYNSSQSDFEHLFNKAQANFATFFDMLRPLRSENNPFEALKNLSPN